MKRSDHLSLVGKKIAVKGRRLFNRDEINVQYKLEYIGNSSVLERKMALNDRWPSIRPCYKLQVFTFIRISAKTGKIRNDGQFSRSVRLKMSTWVQWTPDSLHKNVRKICAKNVRIIHTCQAYNCVNNDCTN